MQDTSFVVVPIRDHAFFEQPQFKSLFGNNLFQVASLAAQVFDLRRGRRTSRIASKAFLAGFQEFLGQL